MLQTTTQAYPLPDTAVCWQCGHRIDGASVPGFDADADAPVELHPGCAAGLDPKRDVYDDDCPADFRQSMEL